MALRTAKKRLLTRALGVFIFLFIATVTTGCGEDWKWGSWHAPEQDGDGSTTTATGSSLFILGVSSPWAVASDKPYLYVTDIFSHQLFKYSISSLDNSATLIWAIGGFGSEEGEFYNPEGVAVAPSGNVYVADRGNGRIQQFSPDGIFLAQWDTSGTFTEPEQVSDPTGIAVDGAGFVYVADANNDQIVKFTGGGIYISHWGVEGFLEGQLDQPQGLDIDNITNSIYVVDGGNNRIQVFTLAGEYQRQFASSGTGNGQLSSPWGVLVDRTTGIYVTDRDTNRVQLFNFSGGFDRVLTFPDAESALNRPTGMAEMGSHLWICETTPNRVRGVEL